jgi:hypothetical protein
MTTNATAQFVARATLKTWWRINTHGSAGGDLSAVWVRLLSLARSSAAGSVLVGGSVGVYWRFWDGGNRAAAADLVSRAE